MDYTCKMSYIANHSKIKFEITTEEAVEEIRSDKHKSKTEEIRRAADAGNTEEANRLKGTLPGIVPSGSFNGARKADCIKEYGYRTVLDIDNLPPEHREEVRRKIEECPYTHVCYTSPKQGQKIIVCGQPVEVPSGFSPQQRVAFFKKYHQSLFRQVVPVYEAIIGCKIDISGSDLPRISYLCHDPHIYYQPSSTPFPVVLNGEKSKKAPIPRKVYAVSQKSGNMLFQVSEMMVRQTQSYEPGNRNNYLFALACKCNEYGVSMENVIELITARYPDMETGEITTAAESAYKNTGSHGISKLSKQQIRVLYAQNYLNEWYDFRFNEIKCLLEYRRKDSDAPFAQILDRNKNSLWVELARHGSECSSDQLFSILNSDFSTSYNPLKEYFGNLPAWDGKDHIALFANRVQTTQQIYWELCLRKWLCAMVAAVIFPDVQNHTVITLHGKQSIGKTSFARSILPPVLKDYYCEDKINTENKDDMIKVYQSLIINTEEVDGMSGRELNQYKALITRSTMNIRMPYDRSAQVRKRMASFMCTTNNYDILTDKTGNRRFLCFETLNFDNESAIDHEQLYAQVMHKLIADKFRFWFSKEESVLVNKHNESFVQQTIEEELIVANLRKPLPADKISYLTAGDIAEIFHKRNGITITHTGKITIGRAMKKMDFERISSAGGVYKYVVHVINFEEVTLNKYISNKIEKEPEATQKKLDL